jgi:putative ABC transport system permease protein
LLRGRAFEARDGDGAEPVVIVDELAAARLWPGQQALGQRFKLGGADSPSPYLRVIGVVASSSPVSKASLFVALNSQRRWPQVYRPLAQTIPRTLVIGAKALRPSAALAIRNAVESVAPQGFDGTVASFRDEMARSSGYTKLRTNGIIVTLIALTAIAIAVVGVYGVMNNSVRMRKREIAIRLAIGADPREVLRFFLMRSALVGVQGIVLGAAGTLLAFALLRGAVLGIARGQLFGGRDLQAAVFALSALAVCAIVTAAGLIPANRAASTEPSVILRED